MNTATYLALGDSYTIGEGVAAGESWPAQLARRLRALGVELADPQIVAATGWTTDELSAAMDAATLAPPYALVSLLIGVNNQYRGRALAEYRDEFAALLARARALAGSPARVFVVSIPDWGVTRFARAQGRDAARVAGEIDAFNAAARTIASGASVPFVDVTSISREAGDGDAMLVADGLHPSAAQYALWAEEIVPVARAVLGHPAQSPPRG
ncbi:SGNH/GDSL hydrolase family protein [Dokdonella sp.]|uniref:SGNH/GDSL hydrolase family protein n=1 Tax=Dokdonella sp. TaxID=2291710 RepID=UPI002F40D826